MSQRVDEKLARRVDAYIEDLLVAPEQHEPPFDLVFIDADKEGYVDYLDLSLQLVRPGSVVLADNLIRNGAVLHRSPKDPLARGVKAFNERIAAHPRLESLILPIIREKLDGLSISLVR